MLVGIYFWSYKLGSNPFVLLRNEGLLDNAPVFHDAAGALSKDYLLMLKDGSGLNASLQNLLDDDSPTYSLLRLCQHCGAFCICLRGAFY